MSRRPDPIPGDGASVDRGAAAEDARRLLAGLPDRVRVRVENPRGSFVKHLGDGRLDYVSPLPCPFNYGCLPERIGGDGFPLDALILGPRRRAGETVELAVLGVVGFVDLGEPDHKVVCGEPPLRAVDHVAIAAFFAVYPWLKRGLARLRGDPRPTIHLGWFPRGAPG